MKVKSFDEKVDDFIENLQKPVDARADRMIDLLKQFGTDVGMPYSKSLGNKLFELRIRGQQEVRIFYTFYQGEAVLLHGFIKKTQKTPLREIETAKKKIKALTTE